MCIYGNICCGGLIMSLFLYVSCAISFFYCFSKIQNKKAKVNSREYLLLKEDVFMRVGVALFFPLGKKLPQIVL
ncbi:hypothetical protein DWZ35_23050 [Bacteroides caccae]|nr:hypothetical protein DWZ35_23050 [Bacteroides caccae]